MIMSNKEKKKFPLSKKIIWNLSALCANGFWGIMSGYLTYYLTQSVLLSSAAVGAILMASKVFDGFTDLIAGYLIERTNSRWGKGRPYTLFSSLAWIFIICIFSVPSFFSTTGKLVYVFVCYTLINSVCLTFFNCADQVYMIRAIPDERDKSDTLAVGGTIVTYGSTVLVIAMPVIITTLCVNKAGWTILALVIGIPSIILSALRFFVIKELPLTNAEGKEVKAEKVSIKDIVNQLIRNKYVLICFGLVFAYYFGMNLSTIVNSYYFTYNIGDLSLLSLIGMTSLVTPLVLLFIPKMLEKLGKTKVLQLGLILNLIACIIRAFAPTNLILFAITSIACSIGTLPMVYFIGLLIIDCMDYGEWKTGYRVESGYSAVTSAANKIAAGFASGFAGLVMGTVGFISGAESQSALALGGIKALAIYAPIAIGAALVILIHYYRLDDKLETIRKELLERRK